MSNLLDDFISSPCEALLDSCTKDQLFKIADHYGIEKHTDRNLERCPGELMRLMLSSLESSLLHLTVGVWHLR